MIRFIRQRNSFTCGPVAIINALKWFGVRVGLKEVAALKTILRTDQEWGTTKLCMTMGINLLFMDFTKIELVDLITFKQLDTALRKGNGVILHYHYKEEIKSKYEGHYIFLTKAETPYGDFPYLVTNEASGEVDLYINLGTGGDLVSKEHLKHRLQKRSKSETVWMNQSPFAWILTPQQE